MLIQIPTTEKSAIRMEVLYKGCKLRGKKPHCYNPTQHSACIVETHERNVTKGERMTLLNL
jgi:pyruvate-formate lyase-activating enzyme